MGAIEDIYADVDADVSEEEFRAAVAEKVEQMGGLADEETAAMLIAHELSDQEVGGIADIEPGMEEVKFLGKVVSVGELRTFERDDADEDGRVANVEVADESGRIRVAFWDEMAASAVEELEAGTVLRIKGRPKEGYDGVEVNADKVEIDDDVDIDVSVDEEYAIEDLSLGLSDVTLRGRVLGTEPVRTFDRDDGSEGRVANLVLGDETGRVRVTLWDDRADLAEAFAAGESVEVVDGYVRERDGDLELHVGDRGAVERIEEDVAYVPEATDIASVEIDQTVDLAGVVRSADPKRTFDRDDGSTGQVRNVRLQDSTGDIRVALWGEKADLELAPGDEIQVADVEIQDGWQDDLEASAGWRSTVTVLDDGEAELAVDVDDGGGEAGGGADDGEADAVGLDAFADDDADADPDAGTAAGPELADGERVEFTGVVVQAGSPVVLDDGERTVSVETDADVELGQEVTVAGVHRAGRIDAEDVR
ncbi:MAG: single-stranded DNA binding protein [Halobacteriales archaeon]